MRWDFGRKSSNVEDRRGAGVSGPVVGGGIGLVLMAIVVTLLGGDPSIILDQVSNGGDRSSPDSTQQPTSPEDQKAADFVSVVLADTEDTWHEIFQQMGKTYVNPSLVLFSNAVQSGCGVAQSASGPFYCPQDQKVYIDLSFYDELQNRFNAPGDFAQAYVLAHEVGHHVQNQLGIMNKVSTLQSQVSPAQANQLSVMLELQADCFAGIWANHANRSRHILEEGDVEEGLNAASSIGDDRLQKQTQGYVEPDSFTHGTSAQRVRWFKQGIQSGDLAQCDTFSAGKL